MITAKYFVFNGHSLDTLNMQIATFNTENIEENAMYQSTPAIEQAPNAIRIYGNGAVLEAPPTIELSIVRDAELGEILPYERAQIAKWLLGTRMVQPIKFFQGDQTDITYYGFFTNLSTIFVNGYCRGFKLTFQCDSYYARGIPTVVNVTNNTGSQHTYTVTINNNSVIDGYVYPTVTFYGPGVSIINTTDSATRAFTFTELSVNERIIVDNETKIITSELGYSRLANFTTKNWLRLRNGYNTLSVTCYNDVTISCPFYMLIGT